MILFKEADALTKNLQIAKRHAGLVGFVPTMGALHDGHLALIRESVSNCTVTVVSIFVNPTQFNDPSDFEKYPSTTEADIRAVIANGADILFLPSVKEIYPLGLKHTYAYNLGYLETILEGKYRPGHFQGVCQVMEKLLRIVQPFRLYMGQKDYQQCMVIKKLLDQLSMDSELIIYPTVREADGLAMSSRNLRLEIQDRKKANTIFHALLNLKNEWSKDPSRAKEDSVSMLEKNGFRIDYVEVADSQTLKLSERPDAGTQIALVAASLGNVRLIDNMVLTD